MEVNMLKNAQWISYKKDMGNICPEFLKEIRISKNVQTATLFITAIGVYEAHINGQRIGNYVLAPGCTVYRKRLQYQTYDVTNMLSAVNQLTVTVGTGWYRGRISEKCKDLQATPCAVIAELEIHYIDGTQEVIITDESWSVRKSNILESDIYDGEIYDASSLPGPYEEVKVVDISKDTLIPQEGEIIREQEQIKPMAYMVSPKGERIIDFGQNLAGYVEFTIDAPKGSKISLSHAEILDKDGNFYTDNYRSSKSKLTYICKEGHQFYKPHFTFYGFRYIRLDEYPEEVNLDNFTAIAVYSDLQRTGYIETANSKINQLYSNTLWSQRSNFLDIPTDCPQRDERMGWTGDAQVFAKTACFNYDCKKFFEKWMNDVRAEQLENGAITDTVPNFWQMTKSSTAWGDAITIIPWQVYLMYGDVKILKDNFASMKKWVDFITKDTKDEFLWTCDDAEKKLWGKHYGDWLGLDAPSGSYKGSTNDDFIASAFYSYSVSLLIKSGKILGLDMTEYEMLHENINRTFKKYFSDLKTQTEHVLALYLDLTDHKDAVASNLVRLIRENRNKIQTGFVGTPYILHVLSENGYPDVAYDLLLQEEYPSWLYEVNHGATTIWEHWDGIRDDGSLWSSDMNSYNHYAYGSVIDWIYTAAAGIKPLEDYPGFEQVKIAPMPDKRLKWLSVSFETKYGAIRVKWIYKDKAIRYEITTPSPTSIVIDGKEKSVKPGSYIFYGRA